ncbi:MAG: SDR family oxidoreductase [Acidobacteriota bacterium]|nr:SDR family oxidoreductase [Acidobacteriota bacterium]
MKSLLITGATGNLGHAVVARFEKEYRCIAIDRGDLPKVDSAFGVLHLAGAFTAGSRPEDFEKMLDASVMSGVRVIESVRDKIEDDGRIVAISSIASLTKPVGLAAYAAAKSALNAYIEVLAKELQKRRITANALLPSTLGEGGVPLERVNAAIAFLLSADAASITGQLIALTA